MTFFDGVLEQFGLKMEDASNVIREGASESMNARGFLETELVKWLNSRKRAMQIKGARYYDYEQDIKANDRHDYTLDADGSPVKTDDLKTSHILDNRYADMVDQKVNYMLGKAFSLQTNNQAYNDLLNVVFDKSFRRMMHSVAIDAMNGGIAWVHPYYNERGEMAFRHFPAHEIFPFWKNDEHTELDLAIRYFVSIAYEGTTEKKVQHVEVYSKSGIERYIFSGGSLIPDVENEGGAYATAKGTNGENVPLAWERIPLVAFKYNQHEIPLIKRVLSIQNAINRARSNWADSMNEDIRDTVLVLRNYDGENIADFRAKLMKYGAVKVTDQGGVETLRIERDAGQYTEYLKDLKRTFVENARGYDAKDDRLNASPNEMNIRSMYSDIDLDADMMETQFQAALDDLLWFVDRYLIAAGRGDFTKEEVKFTFNRNLIVNDSETIANIKNSVGIVSTETLLAHHPFVDNVQEELSRIEKEKAASMETMGDYVSG